MRLSGKEEMELGVVFETSSGQGYAYVTETNQILTLAREWLDSIDPEERPSVVFQILKEANVMSEKIPSRIVWPWDKETYRNELSNHIQAVILEITQECTLRCDYCIYSGNYEGSRTHSDTHMSKEVVKKALDFYHQHSGNSDTAQVSLYGGEALIRFDVVRFAVAYTKELFRGKEISINLATNGTTLTDPVIAWLNDNPEVSVNVTINGSSHDLYRKFPDGTGSLDCIMRNLKKIQNTYPQLWKRVNFICNIVTSKELLEIRQYYRERIGKPPLMITGIIEEGGNDAIQTIVHRKEDDDAKRLARQMYIQSQDEYIKPYFHDSIVALCSRSMTRRPQICECNAFCMPFSEKLFVSATGKLGVCERVNLFNGCGSIESGIDFACAERLLDHVGCILNKKCRFCWCQRLCDVCYKDFIIRDGGELELPESFCEKQKKYILELLILFSEMAEQNPESIRSIRMQLEREQREG